MPNDLFIAKLQVYWRLGKRERGSQATLSYKDAHSRADARV